MEHEFDELQNIRRSYNANEKKRKESRRKLAFNENCIKKVG